MSLETATYINGLDAANPLGSDPLADADGHLRLIKSTLKATFPNITGPVTAAQGTLNNPFPVGGIIMWSGSSIPSGWLLCDGNNSTPDLRDRFVVGSGNLYTTGATGGSATTTLVADNIPAHTHTFSGTSGAGGGHTHSITDPGHRHVTNGSWAYGSANGGGGIGVIGNVSGSYDFLANSTTGITINSVGDHTHSFSGTTSSIGSGTAFSNLPPYYALAFIMKSAY